MATIDCLLFHKQTVPSSNSYRKWWTLLGIIENWVHCWIKSGQTQQGCRCTHALQWSHISQKSSLLKYIMSSLYSVLPPCALLPPQDASTSLGLKIDLSPWYRLGLTLFSWGKWKAHTLCTSLRGNGENNLQDLMTNPFSDHVWSQKMAMQKGSDLCRFLFAV